MLSKDNKYDRTKVYEIDRLMDCDSGNFAESKRALLAVHGESLNAADQCAKLLTRVGELFGIACKYDEHQQQLNEWLKTQPGDAAHYVKLLEQSTLIGNLEQNDLATKAKKALEEGKAVIARTYLIMRLGRDFLFGLSDLLRLRSTGMFGYLRVQTETAAILALATCGLRAGSRLAEHRPTQARQGVLQKISSEDNFEDKRTPSA